jgi:hypothetical protein
LDVAADVLSFVAVISLFSAVIPLLIPTAIRPKSA